MIQAKPNCFNGLLPASRGGTRAYKGHSPRPFGRSIRCSTSLMLTLLKSLHMGTYCAPDYDSELESEMAFIIRCKDHPIPPRGIQKADHPEIHWRNPWTLTCPAEGDQGSTPDKGIEPDHPERKCHYFILGRGYDEDLNLLFDSRKQTSNTQTTQATDTLAEAEADNAMTCDYSQSNESLQSEHDDERGPSPSHVKNDGDETMKYPVSKAFPSNQCRRLRLVVGF